MEAPVSVSPIMEAPVSVSLGIARSLPGKLEQLLSPEADPGMRLSKGEKNKIRLVKERLQEVMGKFLMEASDVEAPASTARCWVKEVRELSYDIDDFLDELIHGLHPAATAAKKNLRGRVAGLREGLSRSRWVSQETARFRARLEEAIERHKRYSLGNIQIPEIRIDSDEPPIPPLYGVEANNRLVGIDSSMEKLGEWLTGDGERQLRVVSIVGLGGVGKTTLAKELYCKLRRQFECRAFVRSSKKPDMRRLLTSILLQVHPQRLPNDTELGNLTGTIRAHLQDKKYFIIIDDLWAPSMWDIVCHALPDDTCCSRVLATTEIDIVAQICSGRNSKHIFKMEPLSDNESKKLFFSRFPVNQSKNNEQLFEVSSEIVRKCGGFPLATITTARLLARQHNSVEQCNCIRRSMWSNLRTDPTIEGVKHVLSLCYNNLPGHLKACMLYVSVYKEDHIIWKDDLVKQWIAQGFICVQEGKGKEEVASTYFDELVNEEMIQPVDINCIGEVLSCTVHYMILELIRYKSIEENFVTAIDHSQVNIRLADKVRRLSLQFDDAEDAAQPTKLRLLQIQSLAFSGFSKSLPSIAEFRLLRVLILHLWGDQDNKRFDLTAICQLFRLRYLEIVCNVNMHLQTKMQGLQHLETLRIDSRISDVPPDIVQLPALLHLSLPSDTNMPNGIGQLTSLQELGCFNLRSNSADNVISLGELTNLQDLRLTCSTMPSDNLEEKLQCLGSILSKLNNLKSLTMSPAGSCNATLEASTSSNAVSCDGLSSLSSPPALLQKLELFPRICIFSTLPKWIGKLRLLRILKIQVMGLSSDDVDTLEGLPALSALLLYVRTAPGERILFTSEGFPVLKYFKFICSALSIAFMKGAMANVQRLKLGFDANTVVQYSPVEAGFEHLTGLGEISVKIGNAAVDESSRMVAQSALEAAFSPHRVNIKLVDWPFYGEKEWSPAARKEKYGTVEHSSPVPDVITKEGSEKQYGIGVYGSKQYANRRPDNRTTVSLESLDNEPEIQELGSAEATRRQSDTGDLSNNNLSGEASSFSLSTTIRFGNEPNLCGPNATKPNPGGSSFPQPSQNPTTFMQSPGRCSFCIGAVASGVAAGAALLFAIPEISFVWCQQRKSQEQFFDVQQTTVYQTAELAQLKIFSLKELRVATDGFNNKNILGSGGFSRVYKGQLFDGSLVAVKRMKEERTPGFELQFETVVEVSTVMAVHRNLLRLRGFCMTQTERVLVYPYMANRSVASRLRERLPSEPPLDWQTRTRIALGSARGLSYLHDHCVQRIIHRGVTASNILLDEDFEAVVGGFSLAKPMDHIVTDLTTSVWGIIGHIAPEYLSTGSISEKTDVYSYGIMLLELITGQRAFDLARLANDDDVILLDWVKGLQKEKKLVKFIDPDIQQNCIHADVESLFQIALLCTQHSPMDRPTMHEVVRMLEGKKTGREMGEAAETSSSSKYSTRLTWDNTDSAENRHTVELSELK